MTAIISTANHRDIPIHIVQYFQNKSALPLKEVERVFDRLIAYLLEDCPAPVPSAVVDEAWHSFILHTKDYQNFCREKVGRFVHHVPSTIGLDGDCSGCSASCGGD